MPNAAPRKDLNTPKASRVAPIASSIKTINGYPKKLVVFRINASPYYWMRVYMSGKYHVRSTKTEHLNEAKDFAKEYFHSLLANPSSTSLQHSVHAVIEAFKEATLSIHPSKYERNNLTRLRNHIAPYFGARSIREISNSDLSKFKAHLSDKDLGSAAIKSNFTLLKKLFVFALNNQYITQIPPFPRIKLIPNDKQPRVHLEVEEYKHLCSVSEALAREEHAVRGTPITLEMKYLIQFMVNSFIRPSDLRVIQHKHVSIKRDGDDSWIQLSHPATKTTDDLVQAMPASVDIYRRLVEDVRGKALKTVNPEEYLFFPQYTNRNTAMSNIDRAFRYIRQRAFPDDDRNITLYSLRHTAIMFRIVIGEVDTFSLAKNARTSQLMIEKFYARHVKTLQLRKQLHAMPAKSDKRKSRKQSTLALSQTRSTTRR